MMRMVTMLNGFFDIHFRLKQLDKFGDPLVKLNEVVPWESFRAELESIRDKERKKLCRTQTV